MGFLFSKKKPEPKSKRRTDQLSQTEEAELELKQSKRAVERFIKKLEACVEKDIETAKKLLKISKVRAKYAIAKKKLHEKQIETNQGKILNIEKMLMDLQEAKLNMEMFEAMKAGTKALTHLNEQLKIEDVEALLDETQEQMDYANEVNELLSSDELSGVTDDDLLAELAELEQADADAVVAEMPEVPDNELVKPVVKDDVVAPKKEKKKVKKEAMLA